MNFFESIFLGVIQGATEFLPVSSSGHLLLAEKFLGLTPDLHFVIFTHVATLLAVCLVYWRDLWKMIEGFFATCGVKNCKHKEEGELAIKLLVATSMTVGVALLIEPYFETFLNLKVVAITLIFTGLMIIGAEKFKPTPLNLPLSRETENVKFTWDKVLLLGLVQGLTIIPGISRSGTTIALLIWMGIERVQAVKISFLLSIPTIAGAGLFSYLDQKDRGFEMSLAQMLGCLAAFVIAVMMIFWMEKLIKKHWILFAPYCIGLGIILMLFF